MILSPQFEHLAEVFVVWFLGFCNGYAADARCGALPEKSKSGACIFNFITAGDFPPPETLLERLHAPYFPPRGALLLKHAFVFVLVRGCARDCPRGLPVPAIARRALVRGLPVGVGPKGRPSPWCHVFFIRGYVEISSVVYRDRVPPLPTDLIIAATANGAIFSAT